MSRTTHARQDAIDTAIRLFRAQGYAGTGLTQLLTESGAPKGSFYFHFPGGKEQLALEALAVYGEQVANWLKKRLQETPNDPATFVRAVFIGTARELTRSEFNAGCVATNLGGEMGADSIMAPAVARVLDSWIEVIADGVASAFDTRELARAYATTLMATLSGSRSMTRAYRSAAPLDAAAEFFIALLNCNLPTKTAACG